tara:strand:+ start:7699 stop:8643 length:945 start_codon:yes stop_codon:yes gene_type:complete
MKNKKNTTTKTVEAAVTQTVEAPTAIKPIQAEKDFVVPPMPKKSNTHGIANLNKPKRKIQKKDSVYQLLKSSKDKRGRVVYPVIYMLKAEDVVYDSEKDVNRKIRYIPGEASVYEDEQKKESKVKSPITFNNGFLAVGRQNPTLKKFLDHCNANNNNPNRFNTSSPVFKMVDNESDAKKKIEKSMKVLDAIRLALEMPLDKLVGYARTMGVNVNKSTDEIRYDMKVLAEKDPASFITGMDDPKTEIKQVLYKAKEYGIIDMNKSNVVWVKGNQRPVITHVPLGVEPMDHMTEYCMAGAGETVLDHIKLQLSNMS